MPCFDRHPEEQKGNSFILSIKALKTKEELYVHI